MRMQIYAVRALRILERVMPVDGYQKVYCDAKVAAIHRAEDNGKLFSDAVLSIGDVDAAVGLDHWKSVYDAEPEEHLESSSVQVQR